MKFILLCVLAFGTLAASAQDSTRVFRFSPGRKYFELMKPGQSIPLGEAGDRIKQFKRFRDSLYLQQRRQAPAGRQVLTLKQDHMPCIIPDTSELAAIPNAWNNPKVPFRQVPGIPNPMDRAEKRVP